jgi:hypothetical protein
MEALLPEPDGKPERLHNMHMRAPQETASSVCFLILAEMNSIEFLWRHNDRTQDGGRDREQRPR